MNISRSIVFLTLLFPMSSFCQNRSEQIEFALPTKAIPVVSELLAYFDRNGWIDSVVVQWGPKRSLCGFEDSYSFIRITDEPEYDETGRVRNVALWLKRRTNRVLLIGDRYRIPLIYEIDGEASEYSGDNVLLFLQGPGMGTEFDAHFRMDPSGYGYLYKNWEWKEDEAGRTGLVFYMNKMDTVLLGW
jgi:hypothetical protein